MAETTSLKALAQRVLERNGDRNDGRNDALKIVSGTSEVRNEDETIPEEGEVLAPASPVAIELIYVEPQPKVTPVDPEFPPCRKCGTRRYWITASGKVECGGRGCGEVCYILASISYHPIS